MNSTNLNQNPATDFEPKHQLTGLKDYHTPVFSECGNLEEVTRGSAPAGDFDDGNVYISTFRPLRRPPLPTFIPN